LERDNTTDIDFCAVRNLSVDRGELYPCLAHDDGKFDEAVMRLADIIEGCGGVMDKLSEVRAMLKERGK
jgi:hypothetical protein